MKTILYFVLIPALLPVFIVLWYVYRKDKMEREPLSMIFKVLFMGAIFAIPCAAAEEFAISMLDNLTFQTTISYSLAENVFGIAFVEELAKWLVLMIFVWNNKNFNYRYDGVVYAVTSSLGFAALENVLYIINYGTGISVGRAIFSIPGHASFGVFMGAYLAMAKNARVNGNYFLRHFFLLLSIAVPTVIHGCYDFLLSEPINDEGFGWIFYVAVLILDILAWNRIHREFKHDRPLEA